MLLILIILLVTIFFCHSLIRLCMLIVKGGRDDDPHRRSRMQQTYGGYAIPRQPIRVVLARDEEAAGIESEATKLNPPAYGLWRESVVCTIAGLRILGRRLFPPTPASALPPPPCCRL